MSALVILVPLFKSELIVLLSANRIILLFISSILSIAEDQLRAKGYDKTPDFILEVPIGKSIMFFVFLIELFILNASNLRIIPGMF